MDWEKRITEAKYTAPSGKEVSFLFGSVSKETDLKTGLFTFPDKDGAHVQHQGAGATSFPLTCIFNGSDCMEQADSFEALLFERGVGELQHPVYGIHKVVPHGKIKRVDDLLSGLNESVVEVTFVKIITDDVIPKLETVAAAEIEEKYEAFSDAACEDFARGVSAGTIDDELRKKSVLNTQTEQIKSTMEPLISSHAGSYGDFLTTVAELKNAVNTMFDKSSSAINKGLNTARFMLNLMRYPSRVVINISEKIKGYSALIATLINQFKHDPFGTRNIANAVMTARLSLSAAAASVASGVALQIAEGSAQKETATIQVSREEAIYAAEAVINLFELVKNFDDTKVKSNAFVDVNNETAFLLSDVVYKSAALIINSSFSLPMRRTIVLDRDRQLIELSAELYGSVDYMDELIFENKLTADEIILLPMGKEITYYVKSA